MSLVARSNYVVATPYKKPENNSRGILLPDNVEKSKVAVVVSVGDKVENLKKDDRFVYREYGVVNLKVNDVSYLIVSDEDILATVQ